eukprot:gene16757-biopygen11481
MKDSRFRCSESQGPGPGGSLCHNGCACAKLDAEGGTGHDVRWSPERMGSGIECEMEGMQLGISTKPMGITLYNLGEELNDDREVGFASWMLEASLEEKIPRREAVRWHVLHNELPVSDGGTAFWSAQAPRKPSVGPIPVQTVAEELSIPGVFVWWAMARMLLSVCWVSCESTVAKYLVFGNPVACIPVTSSLEKVTWVFTDNGILEVHGLLLHGYRRAARGDAGMALPDHEQIQKSQGTDSGRSRDF